MAKKKEVKTDEEILEEVKGLSKEQIEEKIIEKVEEVETAFKEKKAEVLTEKNPIKEKVEKFTKEQLNERSQKSIVEFTEFVKKEKIKISVNLAISDEGKIIMSSVGTDLELSHLWIQFLQRNKQLNKTFHIFMFDTLARSLQNEK